MIYTNIIFEYHFRLRNNSHIDFLFSLIFGKYFLQFEMKEKNYTIDCIVSEFLVQYVIRIVNIKKDDKNIKKKKNSLLFRGT